MPTATRSTAIFAVLLAVLPANAADPKTGALTPKEIADGWIQLFDGETTFGWTATEGVKVTESGKLALPAGKGEAATTTMPFGAGELRVLYTQIGPGIATVHWQGGADGIRSAIAGQQESKTIAITPTEPGPIRFNVSENAGLSFQAIAFKPSTPKSLFNGKDLTGWTQYKGEPKRELSKYDVTPAGELRVINGPGDLRTDTAYADFVLQFDCKTNGKNLNSGVFFRCIAEQYQNGYEAQVQNGYKDDDRTKPTDFGTGAIYRRVAARKVVSNDNEWFTMTVIAVGPRIATWVNGYQTVDWTDDRKPSENPRQGLRTEAGHLSIQGHDPTTDIVFRNLRIGELKAK